MSQSPVTILDAAAVIGNYLVVEHVVSTNSTFKITQFAAISNVLALRMSDWSQVTCIFSGNSVTVTQANLTNVKIVALVAGSK